MIPIRVLKETKYLPVSCLLLYQKFEIPACQTGPRKLWSMETSWWNIYKNLFTGSSSCSFVITKILKLHQLPLTETLKYSLKLKVGTSFFLWVTMSYLKACCLHDTCSMRMQGNWDRITKKYGGTQQGGFIRYVLTLVNLPPILFPNPAPCYSHQSAEPPCFLVISLPPMRRQQSSPASLPHARSPNSRGR